MKNHIGKKVLVTTQAWFIAPDGKEYRSAYGTLKAVHEAGQTLGFIPNRSHANWFIELGDMIIMGCQVMYLTQADEVNKGAAMSWTTKDDVVSQYERPCIIYFCKE